MKLISIIIIILGLFVNNIKPNTNTQNISWDIPVQSSKATRWDIPTNVFSLQWNIPNNNTKKFKGKTPPKEVVKYTKMISSQYNIQTAAMLAACYHERGIKNWYDDFLCGFGATDDLNWNLQRFGGWQRQLRLFAKRANRCGFFKNGILITRHHAQMFAKKCYKTTAWQHYSRVADYISYFKAL